MAINRINNDILSQQLTQESVKKATSGKKEKLQNSANERQKLSLEDTTLVSQDAKRLQETEMILQNALGKLREMDEITENNLHDIKEKININFYSNDTVAEKIFDDIFPESEIKKTLEKRLKAGIFLNDIKKMDELESIDEKKINKIKENIDTGFYAKNHVVDKIADELISVLEG